MMPKRRAGTREETVDTNVRKVRRFFARMMMTQAKRAEARHHRLVEHLGKLKFPDKPLRINVAIKREKAGSQAFSVSFAVNGRTEKFITDLWGPLDSEAYNEGVYFMSQLFPLHMLYQVCQLLDGPGQVLDLQPNDFPDLIGTREGKYDFSALKSFYREVLPAWQCGKVVYKRNSGFISWRETVKKEIEAKLAEVAIEVDPDESVFEELIERMGATKFSNGLRRRLRDRREVPTPHELALDHAAHLCGVPLYTYSMRYLERRLSPPKTDQKSRGTAAGIPNPT